MSESDRDSRATSRNLAQLQVAFTELQRGVKERIDLITDTLLDHSTQIDQVANDMTDGHCSRGANVPLTPFFGNRNEDFAQYVKQFELICDANNYATDKRAQILASYLRDKAFYLYDSLPQAVKTNYDNLKAALEDKFQTSDYKRYAHQKFQERKQRYTEDVTDYGCDIHKLGMAAFASVDADQRDALIREKFISGLVPELHELIVYSNPKTFHEAMTLAERLEGLQAGKRDNASKNIMLLEGISDRLQKLELNRTNPDTPRSQWCLAMESQPPRTPRPQVWNPRAANLNNFRQVAGPRGNRCFKCNQFGHIARNCPRGYNFNSIICRLCNRPGHFARNCQRRGAGQRQRPINRGQTPGQRGPPATYPNNVMPRRNEAMAAIEEEQTECEAEPRWQPLVASLLTPTWNGCAPNRVVRRRNRLRLTDHNNNDLAPWNLNVGSASNELRSSARTLSEQPKRKADDMDRAEGCLPHRKKLRPPLQYQDRQDALAEKDRGAEKVTVNPRRNSENTKISPRGSGCVFLLIVLLLLGFWRITAAQLETKYREAGPMICQAKESKILWKLPETFTCPQGNHTTDQEVRPMQFMFYKRKYVQYQSMAWKCVKITQEMETFTYFFGDENLKKEKKYTVPVSAEECTTMKRFRRCHNQQMSYQGQIFQTNNKLNWYYPGGGINCCKWKKFSVTNCYLYRSLVYKRHSHQRMESGAGDVSSCDYAKGQCILEDGAFLVWDVQNKSFCELIPWKQISGRMYGSSWLSDDSNFALTFTKDKRAKDCQGNYLLLSDQGIAVKQVIDDAHREKRQAATERFDRPLSFKQSARRGVDAESGGFVSSAQLAASLEALEIRWRQNTNFAFSHALNSVCHFMRSVVQLLRTQIMANPTMAVRALLNQSSIFVRSGGQVIEIFPCRQLSPGEFKFLPMNKSCTSQLPVKFRVGKKYLKGYLDPITNIIHRFSIPIDCSMVQQVPLELWGRNFIYYGKTGEQKYVKNIPELKVLQWNEDEAVIKFRTTIFEEIVMYSWDEIQSHISLNDILGSLNKQREVMKHLGITEEDEEPSEKAENVVTSIMDKGYFGFLRGLSANAFQVWTFTVCLYVTLCVVVIHCLPVAAMPPGLNFANACTKVKNIWSRWRYKQQQWYDAIGETPARRWLNLHLNRRKKENPLESKRYATAVDLEFPNQRPKPRILGRCDPAAPPADVHALDLVNSDNDELSRQLPITPLAEVQPFRINAANGEATVTALIDGMQVRTLLDSGSSLTLIPYEIAKQLRCAIQRGPLSAVSMTGHQLPIIGETEAIVRLGQRNLQGKVVVADKAPYDLIIGTDLMKQLGTVRFDFEKGVIYAGDECLPMRQAPTPAGVFLCQEIVIPPRSEAVVMGVCFGVEPERNEDPTQYCFTPSDKLLNKYDVVGQESLVVPHQRLIPVNLSNPGNAPKFLPQKATLGSLDPISESGILCLRGILGDKAICHQKEDHRSPSDLQQLREEINVPDDMPKLMRDKLEALILEYESLFARNEYDLGETPLVEHEIDTGDARPIRQLPFRTPHSLRPYISKKIDEMLQHGIIQPSKSAWGSPVVLVEKKDSDERRFCVDNRRLNDVTIKDSYPLKRIEDAFDMFAGAKYFATMDLQSGFWQIPVKAQHREKTAFITFAGLYEYRKMNFGLCNAPATCQRLMDHVLRGLDLKICMSYIDDVIVPAKNFEELLIRLEMVFQRLKEAGLKLKLKKCHFGKAELKFLGYLVSSEGLKPDPGKIERIVNAKPPTAQDQLRVFLGLTGWCKRFIKGYAHLVEPLTTLLRKHPTFKWTEAAEAAFQELKRRYTISPILAYPDMSKPFLVITDASNIGIGAVLVQLDSEHKERPISYDSRVLNKSERNYSTIEKEMLAVYWALTKKYRPYIYGYAFTVFTDHKPLVGAWNSPPNEGRLSRWCILLQGYRNQMSLEYRPGKKNVVADYLSRTPPAPKEALALTVDNSDDIDIRKEQAEDGYLGSILLFLKGEPVTYQDQDAAKMERRAQNYKLVNGIIYWKGKGNKAMVTALPRSLQEKVLISAHDSLLGGHLGVRKTLSKIQKKYYWPSYHRDVIDWCRKCAPCQARKNPVSYIKAPLLPIEIKAINQRWGWDICGPYPLSRQGNKYILVCTEYMTKFPEAFALPDTKTERLAKIFVENIVLRYGCPEVLLSDQGTNVDSQLIKGICEMLDITKLRTSPYHPQTDGQTERFNRTLNHMISMYVNNGHSDWCEFLPYLLFAYRTSEHESTGETPFFLMYGYDAHFPLDFSLLPDNRLCLLDSDDYKLHVLDSLLRSREIATDRITKAQQKQKRNYDKAAKESSILVGDRVMLFTPVAKKGQSRKLIHKWKGPYRIDKISKNGRNVRIKLPGRRADDGSWVHVNRLKKFFPPEKNDSTNVPASHLSDPDAGKEKCARCQKRGKPSKWIGCDKCEKWYHFRCVGLNEDSSPDDWICADCDDQANIDGNQPRYFNREGDKGSSESDSTVVTEDEEVVHCLKKEPMIRVSKHTENQMDDTRATSQKQHKGINTEPAEIVPFRKISTANKPKETQTCYMLSIPQMETHPLPVPLRTLPNGSIFERYSRGELIGKGGYAKVYAGTRIEDGQPIAMKEIPCRDISSWREVEGRVIPLEVAVLQRCQGIDGVVKLLDFEKHDNNFYLVLERPTMDGDLFDYVGRRKRLNETDARKLFLQVVEIVDQCRRKGVYHRDLKDENILVNIAEERVTLIDFGAASFAQIEPFTDNPGTRVYSPPEWFLEGCYDGESAEVWSLGILLYSMVCGNIPYDSMREIIENQIWFTKALTPECQGCIDWCLKSNPRERPTLWQLQQHTWIKGQTYKEFVEDFRKFEALFKEVSPVSSPIAPPRSRNRGFPTMRMKPEPRPQSTQMPRKTIPWPAILTRRPMRRRIPRTSRPSIEEPANGTSKDGSGPKERIGKLLLRRSRKIPNIFEAISLQDTSGNTMTKGTSVEAENPPDGEMELKKCPRDKDRVKEPSGPGEEHIEKNVGGLLNQCLPDCPKAEDWDRAQLVQEWLERSKSEQADPAVDWNVAGDSGLMD